MKIALTGASGVVGGALAARLGKEYALLALTRGNCDFETLAGVKETLARFAPDVFIHAGWAGTEGGARNDPRLLRINEDASLRLMEMAANAGCRRWIGFGSQAEYAPDIPGEIAEDAPLAPQDAYGATKLALLRAQEILAAARGMEFTWLRIFACYGKNYKPGYVIPYLIGELSGGRMPSLRTPRAVWDYLHADDAADAVARLLAAKNAGGVYNLASGEGVSVGEIALLLADVLGFAHKDALAAQIESNTDAASRRVANVQKISRAFGWHARIGLPEGLKTLLRKG